VVLGFPCNQFGAQEPGTPSQIREFCTTKFDVTFPLFEKVEVKGPAKHAVYEHLTVAHAEPDWNFTKYLVGKDGEVIKRYAPPTKLDDSQLLSDINDALEA
jgi:glutathione peroxidase